MFLFLQLSATDVSARTTMKGAAKCDKHCELQNSVNQQVLERILRFRDIPESMPASVSTHSHSHLASVVVSFCAPRPSDTSGLRRGDARAARRIALLPFHSFEVAVEP